MTDDTDKPQRDEIGNFLPGNTIWKTRPRAGLKPKFETPEALWDACADVIEWYDQNPLIAGKWVNGELKQDPKVRALTIRGLCAEIGISSRMWRQWKDENGEHHRSDLLPIIAYVEDLLYQAKFQCASAGLLHANLIARELGLADKKDLSNTDGTLKPPREIIIRGVEPEHVEDDD